MQKAIKIIIIIFIFSLAFFINFLLLTDKDSTIIQKVIAAQLYLLVIFGAAYFWGVTGALIVLIGAVVSHGILLYKEPGVLVIRQEPWNHLFPVGLLLFNAMLITAITKLITLQIQAKSDVALQRQLQEDREQLRKLTQTCENLKKDLLHTSSLIITVANFAKKVNLAELAVPEHDETTKGNKRVSAIVNVTIESLAKSPNTKYCAVYLFNPHLNLLERKGSAGTPLHEEPPDKIPLGEGLLGRVAETRQTMRYEWSSKDSWQTAGGKTWLTEVTFAIPILYQNQLHGAIYLEKSGVEFQDERLISETIAGFVGLALENSAVFGRSEQMAITDGLTKLFNHNYFMLRLNEFFQAARRYNNALSVIMIDIDHFKVYNDTNGHPLGDIVLEEVAYLIKSNTRETDLAARYGGEEFGLILQQTDLSGACVVAEKIRAAVESHRFHNEEKQPNGNLTISVGVATLTEHTSSAEQLLKDADEQLYMAKHSGRNKVCAQSIG
ncbi:MAG: sensor domain-containing diguanylate cyclase [bacterium]|nr:sensor domain-containing diguanylate cyclase [bacterium]